MRYVLILILFIFCSCGAMKKVRHIDKVNQSVQLSVKTGVVSEDKSEVKETYSKEEKVTERRSNETVSVKDIFMDTAGRVTHIREVIYNRQQEEKEGVSRDSSGSNVKNDKKELSSSEVDYSSKIDSLKKDTQLEQPENSVFGYIGWGILAVCAAIALVIFVRFRK